MENKTTEVFGANVERLPLKDLIKRIGPGLIATGIVIGPGAIEYSGWFYTVIPESGNRRSDIKETEILF